MFRENHGTSWSPIFWRVTSFLTSSQLSLLHSSWCLESTDGLLQSGIWLSSMTTTMISILIPLLLLLWPPLTWTAECCIPVIHFRGAWESKQLRWKDRVYSVAYAPLQQSDRRRLINLFGHLHVWRVECGSEYETWCARLCGACFRISTSALKYGSVWHWPGADVSRIWREQLDLHYLLKQYKLFQDASLAENVIVLLTNPPYNVREVQKHDSSGHDRLNTNGLHHVIRSGKAVMKLYYHGHIFGSC